MVASLQPYGSRYTFYHGHDKTKLAIEMGLIWIGIYWLCKICIELKRLILLFTVCYWLFRGLKINNGVVFAVTWGHEAIDVR